MIVGASRWFRWTQGLALASVVACSAGGRDDAAASRDEITRVPQSSVKRQSIGNCWVYATAGWIESLHLGATNKEINVSESWLTYWHWFDQIANGQAKDAINTGGDFSTATDVIGRYGIVMEGDFVPREADAEMSELQSSAEKEINLSLRSGALSRPEARADRALVRKELDRAFKLDRERSARIDAVFGEAVDRTL